MLVSLWLKWVKEIALSPEKLVHVGITVAEMVEGNCFKSGKVGSCWYDCG